MRRYPVHQVAMAEQRRIQAQQVFLEAPELEKPERQRDVVTEVAEVAQVIGDTLELQQDAAQRRRARWRLSAGRALDRHRPGPGVGDRRVPADAAGEARAFFERHGFEALLDPLVRVTKPFLQPQNLLAHDREAEMPRLDDASVHRADRYLVHALSLDLDERIAVVSLRKAARDIEVLAQRKRAIGPGTMAQPFALIGAVLSMNAKQVVGSALHPAGARVEIGNARVARILARERHAQPEQASG